MLWHNVSRIEEHKVGNQKGMSNPEFPGVKEPVVGSNCRVVDALVRWWSGLSPSFVFIIPYP